MSLSSLSDPLIVEIASIYSSKFLLSLASDLAIMRFVCLDMYMAWYLARNSSIFPIITGSLVAYLSRSFGFSKSAVSGSGGQPNAWF